MPTKKEGPLKRPHGDPSDAELKLDDQVSSFLGLNYNLTFFLITAAVGSMGFTLNLLIGNKLFDASSVVHLSLVLLFSISSLMTAWLALSALTKDVRSFRLHLKYRHERKSYTQLSEAEKKEWDEINEFGVKARKWSRRLLVLSIAFQVFTLLFLLVQKGETAMHHYGEDSTYITTSESAFDIEFKNKETGQKITMHVPRAGIKRNPSESTSLQDIQRLTDEVAHVLRQFLD